MIRLAITAAVLLGCASAMAQPRHMRDQDWPCEQIKVADLSLAAVWDGPPVDTDSTAWRDDPTVAKLVAAVAPRRVPVDTANTMINDFARQAGTQKQQELLLVLAGLFNVLDQERGSVMAGLDRFGARQKELAAQIRGKNEKLQGMQAQSDADQKAMQALTQEIQWDLQV
ncbi:MAG TPA: hypothetical protein VHO91_16560, partial [Rhodopila sp.]|nr:hypothetical protein [Rhodopila sp.]